jgi:hypothetical protein
MLIKLPKQWDDWCRAAKLRPTSGKYGKFYLKGRGHHWRVNCFKEFELGDTYTDFDRWVLSDRIISDLPKSKAEFLETVTSALARYKDFTAKKPEQ